MFASTNAASLPPKTGKFFYADFDNLNSYGLHAVSMQVDGSDYDFFMSTNEYSIGLISKKCRPVTCSVPKLYQSSTSKTYKSINSASTKTDVVAVYDESRFLLQEAYFHGAISQEDFSVKLKSFSRETHLKEM